LLVLQINAHSGVGGQSKSVYTLGEIVLGAAALHCVITVMGVLPLIAMASGGRAEDR
jgi:hypothetical protein